MDIDLVADNISIPSTGSTHSGEANQEVETPKVKFTDIKKKNYRTQVEKLIQIPEKYMVTGMLTLRFAPKIWRLLYVSQRHQVV